MCRNLFVPCCSIQTIFNEMINIVAYCHVCQKEYRIIKDEKEYIRIECSDCSKVIFYSNPVNGYIYVLSNPCMPELVKIGYTSRNVNEIINELNSSTGVPENFVIEATFSSECPDKDEQIIHVQLTSKRINKNREFFQSSPTEAVNLVEEILGKPPEFLGSQGVVRKENIIKNAKEIQIKEKREWLLAQGVYKDDPGDACGRYSYVCSNCNN